MSGLAAGADTLIEFQVMTHHRDVFERFGTISYQRGVFYRRGDPAVFDEVRFLEAAKTNFPLVMSTCPPPKLTA